MEMTRQAVSYKINSYSTILAMIVGHTDEKNSWSTLYILYYIHPAI